MKIAMIGSGHVGGALATKWAKAGHILYIGVRNPQNFKGQELISNPNTSVASIEESVILSEVIVLATPAMAAVEVAQGLGNTEGKIIIDTMNIIQGKGPVGYKTTTEAILAHTQTRDVVKCFNTTGFNNMINPQYGETSLDVFVAGDSEKAKKCAQQLALDAGFAECYSIGGNEKFELMEQFAWFWINLAMFQGLGREIGLKLLRRS